MAGHHNGDWVFAIGSAHRTNGLRAPDLTSNLAISAGFAERDRRQRLPDFLLESGAGDIELEGKRFALSREVVLELTFRLAQHRMVIVFLERAQPDPVRTILLPQDRRKPAITGDKLQHADR